MESIDVLLQHMSGSKQLVSRRVLGLRMAVLGCALVG